MTTTTIERPEGLRELLSRDGNPRDVLEGHPLEWALKSAHEIAGYEHIRESNSRIARYGLDNALCWDGDSSRCPCAIKGANPARPDQGWPSVQHYATAMAWDAEIMDDPELVPLLLDFLTPAERDHWQRWHDFNTTAAALPDEQANAIPAPDHFGLTGAEVS